MRRWDVKQIHSPVLGWGRSTTNEVSVNSIVFKRNWSPDRNRLWCWLTWSCRIIHVMCMSHVAYRFQAVLCPDPLWTTGSVIAQTHAPTRTVWPLLAFQVWKCGTKRKFQLSHLRNSKRKKQLTSLGGLYKRVGNVGMSVCLKVQGSKMMHFSEKYHPHSETSPYISSLQS